MYLNYVWCISIFIYCSCYMLIALIYDICCYIMFTSVTSLLFMFTFNSLVPGRCGSYFKSIHFRLIIPNNSLGSRCHIALRWMSQNLTNEKSALIQVMACCCQATSYYLSQCWPRSMSLQGITMPQWVKGVPYLLFMLFFYTFCLLQFWGKFQT